MLTLAFVAAAFPQSSVLDRFAGAWKGEGKVNGRESKVEMVWEPVTGGRHYRIGYRNSMEGGTVFEGTALYSPNPSGGFSGLWVDSFGFSRPIVAEFSNETLTSNWGSPETEEGRTEYRLTGADSMQVTDFVRTKDGWREFGRVSYRRASDATAVVKAFTAAYNRGDLAAMLALVHPDVSWHRIDGGTIKTETRGKQALRESLVPYFAGERTSSSVIEGTMESGDFVIVTERASWKDKDGVQKSQAAVIVYEFKDGLILNIWDFPAYR